MLTIWETTMVSIQEWMANHIVENISHTALQAVTVAIRPPTIISNIIADNVMLASVIRILNLFIVIKMIIG